MQRAWCGRRWGAWTAQTGTVVSNGAIPFHNDSQRFWRSRLTRFNLTSGAGVDACTPGAAAGAPTITMFALSQALAMLLFNWGSCKQTALQADAKAVVPLVSAALLPGSGVRMRSKHTHRSTVIMPPIPTEPPLWHPPEAPFVCNCPIE